MSVVDTLGARTADEVRALAGLSLPALRSAWRSRWGAVPGFRSRDLMARAMAHKIQAEAFGDLASPVRRKAAAYAVQFSSDRTYTPTPGPVLKPGSSLIREWKGRRHEVEVTGDGFRYQGQQYGSLSKVAQAITGTKWNGYVFFGLKSRGRTR